MPGIARTIKASVRQQEAARRRQLAQQSQRPAPSETVQDLPRSETVKDVTPKEPLTPTTETFSTKLWDISSHPLGAALTLQAPPHWTTERINVVVPSAHYWPSGHALTKFLSVLSGGSPVAMDGILPIAAFKGLQGPITLEATRTGDVVTLKIEATLSRPTPAREANPGPMAPEVQAELLQRGGLMKTEPPTGPGAGRLRGGKMRGDKVGGSGPRVR